MKKFFLGISLSALIFLSAIFILSKNKAIIEEDKYYTIPRILTFHYEEKKTMSFEVFINNEHNLIEFVEENSYFLVDEKGTYQLNEVAVNKEKDYTSKEEVFFKYTLSCTLLNLSDKDMVFKNCFLRVKNDTFSLECPIGYVAIYKNEYQPLNFTDLYGNYAYIQGELHLIGITLQLDSAYKELNKASIGEAYVQLANIEQDKLYDSERLEASLKHSVVAEETEQMSYKLKAKQNYYFLPVSYPNLTLFTSGCILIQIDGKTYYIEDFTYLANEISIFGYPHTKKEGKVIYA